MNERLTTIPIYIESNIILSVLNKFFSVKLLSYFQERNLSVSIK